MSFMPFWTGDYETIQCEAYRAHGAHEDISGGGADHPCLGNYQFPEENPMT